MLKNNENTEKFIIKVSNIKNPSYDGFKPLSKYTYINYNSKHEIQKEVNYKSLRDSLLSDTNFALFKILKEGNKIDFLFFKSILIEVEKLDTKKYNLLKNNDNTKNNLQDETSDDIEEVKENQLKKDIYKFVYVNNLDFENKKEELSKFVSNNKKLFLDSDSKHSIDKESYKIFMDKFQGFAFVRTTNYPLTDTFERFVLIYCVSLAYIRRMENLLGELAKEHNQKKCWFKNFIHTYFSNKDTKSVTDLINFELLYYFRNPLKQQKKEVELYDFIYDQLNIKHIHNNINEKMRSYVQHRILLKNTVLSIFNVILVLITLLMTLIAFFSNFLNK